MKNVMFTTEEAPGGMQNGTRVSKKGSEPGDTHQDGALATVIGSMGDNDNGYGYFVHWDDLPGIPVAIAGHRLEKA